MYVIFRLLHTWNQRLIFRQIHIYAKDDQHTPLYFHSYMLQNNRIDHLQNLLIQLGHMGEGDEIYVGCRSFRSGAIDCLMARTTSESRNTAKLVGLSKPVNVDKKKQKTQIFIVNCDHVDNLVFMYHDQSTRCMSWVECGSEASLYPGGAIAQCLNYRYKIDNPAMLAYGRVDPLEFRRENLPLRLQGMV